jgi:hypothetical protein
MMIYLSYDDDIDDEEDDDNRAINLSHDDRAIPA